MSALPSLEEVHGLFVMLFGDNTVCKPGKVPMPSDTAAVIASYRDNTGALKRVLACDLSFANSAGAALSMIPMGIVNDATKAGNVPDNIFANLQEVMNIAVNLFADSFGERLELSIVARTKDVAPEIRDAMKAGQKTTFDISIPRYSAGRVSLIAC